MQTCENGYVIEAEDIKRVLSYDPETGLFERRVASRGRNGGVGPCGHKRSDGYIEISLKGKRHYAHRLAFAMMGLPVPDLVDHVNRDRSDNRFCNLRPATHSLNVLNSFAVGAKRFGRKWYVRHRHKQIGKFECFGVAVKAYQAVRDKSVAAEVAL